MADPFDPLRGAWILLLVMVAALFAVSALRFCGCVAFHVEAMCPPADNLKDLGLEVIAATLVLLAQRR